MSHKKLACLDAFLCSSFISIFCKHFCCWCLLFCCVVWICCVKPLGADEIISPRSVKVDTYELSWLTHYARSWPLSFPCFVPLLQTSLIVWSFLSSVARRIQTMSTPPSSMWASSSHTHQLSMLKQFHHLLVWIIRLWKHLCKSKLLICLSNLLWVSLFVYCSSFFPSLYCLCLMVNLQSQC